MGNHPDSFWSSGETYSIPVPEKYQGDENIALSWNLGVSSLRTSCRLAFGKADPHMIAGKAVLDLGCGSRYVDYSKPYPPIYCIAARAYGAPTVVGIDLGEQYPGTETDYIHLQYDLTKLLQNPGKLNEIVQGRKFDLIYSRLFIGRDNPGMQSPTLNQLLDASGYSTDDFDENLVKMARRILSPNGAIVFDSKLR